MGIAVVLFVAFVVSVVTIRVAMPLAVRVGLVDKPGGHKQHEHHVPLVGGIAIFLSVFLAWLLAPFIVHTSINSIFVGAGGLLFAVGLLDDKFQLSVRFRFGAQVVAAGLLIYGNIILVDLGSIFSAEVFVLGLFSLPITLFAIVGAINAMNLLDGVDGLAGLVAAASVSLLALVAFVEGSQVQLLVSICVLGGLIGFLLHNMPLPGLDRAQIFLGDAGSTLLGFLIAYLLISMSQGEQRAISPVTALWLFSIPLMDTLGVGIRRIWLGKSPFTADRGHIHHLMLDAGFRVRHAVLIIAGLQLVLGVVGLAGHYSGVSEVVLFIAFFTLCGIYTYLISRPWRFVPHARGLHHKSGLVAQGVQQVYVGNLCSDTAADDVEALLGDAVDKYPFGIYRYTSSDGSENQMAFALVDAGKTDGVRKLLSQLQQGLTRMNDIDFFDGLPKLPRIGQYRVRKPQNDRRSRAKEVAGPSRRSGDRRLSVLSLVHSSRGYQAVESFKQQPKPALS